MMEPGFLTERSMPRTGIEQPMTGLLHPVRGDSDVSSRWEGQRHAPQPVNAKSDVNGDDVATSVAAR